MSAFDVTIRGGTIVTASDSFRKDVGIRDGRVVALEESLTPGIEDVDARDRLVLPGGVDSHCHIEQLSSFGVLCADDFHSATVSAAFGGSTTVIPFCAQHRGDALPVVLADYAARAKAKAVIDYGFHLIVANPDERTLTKDLPEAIAEGIRSFKIFMTYERTMLSDEQILDVLAVGRRHGALVMVHAENHGMITWLAGRMTKSGRTSPRYHAICHTRGSEAEAINRVIALAELGGCPILIVHVSTPEGIQLIREAQARGQKVFAETCPQYLFLTAQDIDRPGVQGAAFCCSPPPRDEAAQKACWEGLKDGTLTVYSSDHAPYRMDATGKLPNGEHTTFKQMANGVPGLELRLPLLFTFGVGAGRISLNEFVALGAAKHAQTYGCYPQKGTIAIGSDADIAIWDPSREVHITPELVHDNTGYTPYEGRMLRGWPVVVFSRGQRVVDDGRMLGRPGQGRFVARDLSEAMRPAGRRVPEIAQLEAWGRPLED
jgi:dihydropyrimidinase